MASFILAAELQRDTYLIADLPLCRLLLMDDASYPWLVLVPRRLEIREIFELAPADQILLVQEISQIGKVLSRITAAHKINVASLGNIVPQLHVHIVARFSHDQSWPGPVWGRFARTTYTPSEREVFVKKFNDEKLSDEKLNDEKLSDITLDRPK